MMMGYGYGSSMGWLGMGFGMIMNLAFTALITPILSQEHQLAKRF